MKNSVRVIVFSIALAVVCSALLAGVSLFTAPFRNANEKAEEVHNILGALNAQIPAEPSAAQLLDIFEKQVEVVDRSGISLYEFKPGGGGNIEAIAVPVKGPGLWGPIEGVVALEPDLETIRGVRFFKQEETPGLGGEIGALWFQEQFAGKKLRSADGKPGFRILKPSAETDINSVDGITGATMTSDKVAAIMDSLAAMLEKVR